MKSPRVSLLHVVYSTLIVMFLSLVISLWNTQTGRALQTPTSTTSQSASQMISRQEVTSIIAESRRIVTPNGVEELLPIQINGATQWLSIRGRDRRNPVLLFLHGGPGSPTMPADWTFQNPWEDYFTVVQWDQRGTGKTYASNDSRTLASSMTILQLTEDAEQVVRYLQQHCGKKEIFVLGHSFGSVLGIALAQRHPEWLYAYLGVGQMINARRSEEEGFQFAKDEARSHHNTDAERELAALAPYPGGPDQLTFGRIGAERKWLMFYGGLTYGRTDYMYESNTWTLSPDYSDKELDAIDDGSQFSLSRLLPELESLDYEKVVKFKCPIFLFEGRHDYSTSHTLAAEWFGRVEAPSKKLVWFNNSAHMVMQEEPGRFLYHLITDLRPIAATAGDAAPGGD